MARLVVSFDNLFITGQQAQGFKARTRPLRDPVQLLVGYTILTCPATNRWDWSTFLPTHLFYYAATSSPTAVAQLDIGLIPGMLLHTGAVAGGESRPRGRPFVGTGAEVVQRPRGQWHGAPARLQRYRYPHMVGAARHQGVHHGEAQEKPGHICRDWFITSYELIFLREKRGHEGIGCTIAAGRTMQERMSDVACDACRRSQAPWRHY